jgi:serine protease AprX
MKYILILLIAVVSLFAGTIQPALQQEMTSSFSTDLIPVFILVQGELDTDWIDAATANMTRAEKQRFVVDALKERAEISQAPVLTELEAFSSEQVVEIHTFWLANAVYCEATPDVIRQMSNRCDVSLVEKGNYENSGLIEPVEVREPSREEAGKALTWGVSKINADDVWALGYNGSGVIVGVIDTGTDYNHPDLHNNMWHDTAAGYHYGYDFYDNDNDPMDTYGHGTHTSGTICGSGTNGTQTGVAPGATCMALRINYYVGGYPTWIQAMEFGTDHGAAVLSMSMGTTNNSTLRTAEENLLTAGVFHSVSAGNSGPGSGTIGCSGDCPPPWFHPDQTYHGGQSAVITVGATDSGDNIASFSSRGPVTWWSDYSDTSPLIDPDISGPGVDVVSTEWGTGGYTTMDGTSMSAPHIAGVAALMLSANPSLSVAKLDSLIEVTSMDLGSSGKDNTYGAGRVDAYQAVLGALSLVGIADNPQGVDPSGLLMGSINPNPVHGLASFEICTENPGMVDIGVFDLSGRRIAIVSSEEIAAGTHAYSWIVPETVGNGIYFVRAKVNGITVSSRMTIIK